MIDFDEIDEWAPRLSEILTPLFMGSGREKLGAARPGYIEDARDFLFDLTDRDAVIDLVLAWICSEQVVGYHGSRLTEEESESVRAVGLIPLNAESRRVRIERALSSHPEWPKVSQRVSEVLNSHGPAKAAGYRENQVHLTFSRSGLVRSFNHYLSHGAEFDQIVAHELLGPSGVELLAEDGEPRLIQVAVPGVHALDAAHPFFSVDDLRARGEIPNLVNEIVKAWAFRATQPGFQSRSLRADFGMMFRSVVPPAWILQIERISLQPSEN